MPIKGEGFPAVWVWLEAFCLVQLGGPVSNPSVGSREPEQAANVTPIEGEIADRLTTQYFRAV